MDAYVVKTPRAKRPEGSVVLPKPPAATTTPSPPQLKRKPSLTQHAVTRSINEPKMMKKNDMSALCDLLRCVPFEYVSYIPGGAAALQQLVNATEPQVAILVDLFENEQVWKHVSDAFMEKELQNLIDSGWIFVATEVSPDALASSITDTSTKLPSIFPMTKTSPVPLETLLDLLSNQQIKEALSISDFSIESIRLLPPTSFTSLLKAAGLVVALSGVIAEVLYAAYCYVFLDDDGVEIDLRDDHFTSKLSSRYVLYGRTDFTRRLSRSYPSYSIQRLRMDDDIFDCPGALCHYALSLRLERHFSLLWHVMVRQDTPTTKQLMTTQALEIVRQVQHRLEQMKTNKINHDLPAYLSLYTPMAIVPSVRATTFDKESDHSEGGVLARVLWHAITLLEKPGDDSELSFDSGSVGVRDTLHLLLFLPFHPTRRGRWWVRLVKVLEKISRAYALDTALQGLKDKDVVGGARVCLQSRAAMISRSKPLITVKQHPFPSLRENTYNYVIFAEKAPMFKGPKTLWISRFNHEPRTVEELTMDHLMASGEWHGIHSESRVWRTIFAVLMKDELFQQLPPHDNDHKLIFRHAFQDRPLDLLTVNEFYANRSEQIESKLTRIENGEALTIFNENHDIIRYTNCHGCFMGYPRDTLAAIVENCPGKGLATVMRLLARNYVCHSAGLPDLIFWRVRQGRSTDAFKQVPNEQRVCLVEVKGPNDKLSDDQRFWIDQLEQAAWPVMVCKVKSQFVH